MKELLTGVAVIAGIIGIVTFSVWLDSGDSATEPSYAEIECSQCESDLEDAEERISMLEECISDTESKLGEIQYEATNAWYDYDTMGDSLDNIYNYSDMPSSCP